MAQELYMYLTIGVTLLFLIGLWLIFRIRKRKTKRQFNIPNDTLQTFNEIERRYLGNKNGNGNPYETLWKFTRESCDTTRDRGSEEIVRTTGVCEQPIQRNNIQVRTNIQPEQIDDRVEEPKRNSNNRFATIFRRTKPNS